MILICQGTDQIAQTVLQYATCPLQTVQILPHLQHMTIQYMTQVLLSTKLVTVQNQTLPSQMI